MNTKKKFLEMIEEITNPWENYGKSRYYFKEKDLSKAGAYFSIEADSGKYRNKLTYGYVCATKCYNGRVADRLTELLGETVDFRVYE